MSNKSVLGFLLRRSPGGLLLAVLAGLLSGAASTGLLAVVYRVLSGDDSTDPSDGYVLWVFVGLCVLTPLLRWLSQYLLVELGQRLVFDLRLGLAQRVLATPLARLEALGGPRLLASLIDDVGAISEGMLLVPNICIMIAIVLGCLVFMAWLSLPMFGAFLVIMLLGVLSYQLPLLFGERRFQRAREEEDQLFGHFRGLIDGNRELKMHHRRQQAFLDQLAGSSRLMYRLFVSAYSMYSFSASWGHLLVFVVIGVLVFLLPGTGWVAATALVGYTLTMLYMMNPLQGILDTLPALGRAGVALGKVERLGLELSATESGANLPPAPAGGFSSFELRDVVYEYAAPDGEAGFTLGPMNLELRAGEVVFLVGGNGSGKTTLAKLLLALYPPTSGQILVDGKPLDKEELEHFRQSFAVVFSDPFLFDQLLGLEGPDLDQKTRHYLAALRLDHKVKVRDGVFSTIALSQGQRKRLALLTAYLEARPAFLFDEWAADQDPEFRELFYYEILPALKGAGRTVIAISHDDRFYPLADRIVKLEYGQIVFDGSHEDLAQRIAEIGAETHSATVSELYKPPSLGDDADQAPPGRPTAITLPPPAVHRSAARWAIGVSMLILLGLAGSLEWFRRSLKASLPLVDGTAEIAVLAGAVEVSRDALGVPTIRGTNRRDVAVATGFVHAQERFFQMDLLRRRSAGELAGLIGGGALPVDREIRIHRFRSVAEEALAHLPRYQRELLDAYAEGVNSGLDALAGRPFEYLALRADPRPWEPVDCLLVLVTMFVQLQEPAASTERMLSTMKESLPPSLFEFLTPSGSRWDAAVDGSRVTEVVLPSRDEVDLRRLPEASASRRDPLRQREPVAGSNAWVVGGQHTGGAALLANDLHLELGVPNLWYRARLIWPEGDGERHLNGVTLPGAPALVLGSNGDVAWGLTNSVVDTMDVVVLDPVPGAPDSYLTPAGPRQLEVFDEVLDVRGEEPQVMQVSWSSWGPVIDGPTEGEKRAIAWTPHHKGAIDFSIFDLETAATVAEAIDVAHRCGLPALNFLVADRAGQIGWTLLGKLPWRMGHGGKVQTSWAAGEHLWRGFLPAEQVPRVIGPSSGLLWSANNRMVGGADLALLGDGGYQLGARASQIHQQLLTLDEPEPEDMLAIQLDDRALLVDRWRHFLLEVLDPGALAMDPRKVELRRLVESWDGRASVDAVGYRLVRAFRLMMMDSTIGPLTAPCREADPSFDFIASFRQIEQPMWRLIVEQPQHLLDPRYGTWSELFLATVDRLLDTFPDAELSESTWGRLNTARIQHPFAAQLPFLGRFLDMSQDPLPGDEHMPRVQGSSYGASLRMVVAPGREEEGVFQMPGGQSGHPASPHYRDSHTLWVEGASAPLLPGPPQHVLNLMQNRTDK